MAGRINYRNPDERNADARTALAQEKFDYKQARDAMDAASKSAELEAKTQHYQQLNEFKDQRLQQFQEAQDISRAHADLAAAQSAAKADTMQKVLEQATGFLKDARGMDPSKPQFDTQYQNLIAGYPLAAEHPSVKEWIGYHKPLREKFLTEEIVLRKPGTQQMSPQEKIAAQEQAMTQGALTFGHLDEKGKIVPDKEGGQATHVSAFYTNPITGKMDQTPPMTIDEFKSFEKKAKEAKTATSKALDADTATKLLGEAGGDKEKARQLAKERGFNF